MGKLRVVEKVHALTDPDQEHGKRPQRWSAT
jgi:hypothetical protein